MSDLVTMQVYVIENRNAPNIFVWAASIAKAHEYGHRVYPSSPYNVRLTNRYEWNYLDEQEIRYAL